MAGSLLSLSSRNSLIESVDVFMSQIIPSREKGVSQDKNTRHRPYLFHSISTGQSMLAMEVSFLHLNDLSNIHNVFKYCISSVTTLRLYFALP